MTQHEAEVEARRRWGLSAFAQPWREGEVEVGVSGIGTSHRKGAGATYEEAFLDADLRSCWERLANECNRGRDEAYHRAGCCLHFGEARSAFASAEAEAGVALLAAPGWKPSEAQREALALDPGLLERARRGGDPPRWDPRWPKNTGGEGGLST